MTYGTPVTCRFGAPSRPGPAPERPQAVRLTEAELGAAMLAMAARDRMEALRRSSTPERVGRQGAHPRASGPRVLRALADMGPLSRPALRRALGMDDGQVSRVVRELMRDGLVAEGGLAPDSRQARLVALTPAGRAQVTA